MAENLPEQAQKSGVQVFLGLLLGILISIACFVIAIFLGLALRVKHDWLFPVFVAVGLVTAGIIAIRHVRESSIAVGVVICLCLALLLDGTCALTFR